MATIVGWGILIVAWIAVSVAVMLFLRIAKRGESDD